MDKKLTPFHCWTEYWKGKEMIDRLWVESYFGQDEKIKKEYQLLEQRVKDWEERHIKA